MKKGIQVGYIFAKAVSTVTIGAAGKSPTIAITISKKN
jgi:hypothetical protein